MTPCMKERFDQAVKQGKTEKPRRYFPVRILAISMLIVVLVAGFALAASTWSIQDFLTTYDHNDQPQTNPNLAEKIQPVGDIRGDDRFSVEVKDILCDRSSLAIAWTLTNLTEDENLYIMCDVRDADGLVNLENNRGHVSADAVLLAPGEQYDLAHYALLREPLDVDTLNLAIVFTVLSHKGEVILGDGYFTGEHVPMEGLSMQERTQLIIAAQAKDKEKAETYETLRKENPDTLFFHGERVELPYGYPETDDYVKDLTDSGLMQLVDAWTLNIEVDVDNDIYTALEDGNPIYIALPDHTLEITRADLTDTTLMLEFSTTVKSAPRTAFPPQYVPYASDLETWLTNSISNPDANKAAELNNGGMSHGYMPQEDGRWSAVSSLSVHPLLEKPDTIILVPLSASIAPATAKAEDIVVLHFKKVSYE